MLLGTTTLFQSLTVTVFLVAFILGISLSYLIYRRDKSNLTNQLFGLLGLLISIWMTAMYISLQENEILGDLLFWIRLTIFLAVPMNLLFFLFAYNLTSGKNPPIWLKLIIFIPQIFLMIVSFSPIIFYAVEKTGTVPKPAAGPGFLIFVLYVVMLNASAIYLLLKKAIVTVGTERARYVYVMVGTLLMHFLFIGTISIPVGVFQTSVFVPLFPIYPLIFLGFTARAVIKYNLFNIKVFLTEVLTLLIWTILFAKIFSVQSIESKLIDIGALIFSVIFGFYLIKSVRREVEQREKIEILAKDLEVANERQEGLIHFISHEVKGYLTKSQGAFSGVVEGDYDPISPEMKKLATEALADTRKGVKTVMDILNASNLKKGTVKYDMHLFDLKQEVANVIANLKQSADAKNLTIETNFSNGDFSVVGDQGQISEHVIRNLIDNSIKYTLTGGLVIGLVQSGDMIRFSVKDTGIGISPEDKAKLFTEGGRGKESMKMNVDSTGYGLFIAKSVIEAHGGKIWAESEGVGKGSTFAVELPKSSIGHQEVVGAHAT